MAGFFAFVVIVVLGILGLVWGIQAIGVRRDRIEPPAGVPRPELERLETALTVLESRVDELQEQQRFLERLLEARPERGSLPRGTDRSPPTTTPGGQAGDVGAEDAGTEDARAEDAGLGDSILFDTGPGEGER